MTEETAVATRDEGWMATHAPQPPSSLSPFGSHKEFEAAQRMAMALSKSKMVPQIYQNNVADCVIALEMSSRIGSSVLTTMQNLYIVHGKPAWSSTFLIACVNASGRFSPLRYKWTGEKGQDSWGCIAWATDKDGEVLEGTEVTIGMAKAEQWFQKNGSKWKTIPQLMLQYRAATFFARVYAPEVSMGIRTEHEIIDIAPVVTEPRSVGNQKEIKDLPVAPGVEDVTPEPAKSAKNGNAAENDRKRITKKSKLQDECRRLEIKHSQSATAEQLAAKIEALHAEPAAEPGPTEEEARQQQEPQQEGEDNLDMTDNTQGDDLPVDGDSGQGEAPHPFA